MNTVKSGCLCIDTGISRFNKFGDIIMKLFFRFNQDSFRIFEVFKYLF